MKKPITLSEVQLIEIGILDYINEVFKSNNLTYFLAGGTLLGAIRHKGFIPWDNDIDISMPRPDYDKAVKILRESLDKRYTLLEISDNNDYYYPFVKIVDSSTTLIELTNNSKIDGLGVFVDIFPLDGISNDNNKAHSQLRYVNKWGYIIAYSIMNKNELTFFKKCIHYFWYMLFKILGRKRCFERVNDVMRKNQYGTTKKIVSTYGARGEKEIIDYECFASTVDVEFEGKKYPAPVGYDQYLRQMYGDYMKLPPVEERIEPHDVEVYLKEDDE